jgi:hypothetical protein
MANQGGTPKSSADRFVSDVPLNLTSDFVNEAERLTSGQLRYTGWDYHDKDSGKHYSIKPITQCFLADGVTQATQAGTWGTLPAHWQRILTESDLKEQVANSNSMSLYKLTEDSEPLIAVTSGSSKNIADYRFIAFQPDADTGGGDTPGDGTGGGDTPGDGTGGGDTPGDGTGGGTTPTTPSTGNTIEKIHNTNHW